MKNQKALCSSRRTLHRVLLFIAIAGLLISAKTEMKAGDAENAVVLENSDNAALLAKCTKILNYGSLNQYDKPSKGDAVIALGLLGDERAVPVLVEHLQNEANDNLRAQIVKSLGWIGSKSSVPALEAALQDKYLHVRNQASRALKQITGKEYDYDHTGEAEARQRVDDMMKARKEKTGKPAATTVPAATPTPSVPVAPTTDKAAL
jgi:hypothetical protein